MNFDEATGADIKLMKAALSRLVAPFNMELESFSISPGNGEEEQAYVSASFSLSVQSLESPEQTEQRETDDVFGSLMEANFADNAEALGEKDPFADKVEKAREDMRKFLLGEED